MENKNNYLWLKFLEKVKNSNPEMTVKIFNFLLSVDEKEAIMKRLAAVNLIRAGKSYKEIGKILWMSPSTVSAVKKSMAFGTSGR